MLNGKHTLNDRETISLLFQKGIKVRVDPILFISMKNKHEKVLFTVSKKNMPRAVDRNKIKRQMRAIFFNNRRLVNNNKKPEAMAFIYLEKSMVEYSKLLSSMTAILKNIN